MSNTVETLSVPSPREGAMDLAGGGEGGCWLLKVGWVVERVTRTRCRRAKNGYAYEN